MGGGWLSITLLASTCGIFLWILLSLALEKDSALLFAHSLCMGGGGWGVECPGLPITLLDMAFSIIIGFFSLVGSMGFISLNGFMGFISHHILLGAQLRHGIAVRATKRANFDRDEPRLLHVPRLSSTINCASRSLFEHLHKEDLDTIRLELQELRPFNLAPCAGVTIIKALQCLLDDKLVQDKRHNHQLQEQILV